MQKILAALILANRVPRTDSRLEVADMIAFAIDMFLAAVVAGPEMLERVRAQLPGGAAKRQPSRASA